jgi:hypothetical protein
MKIRRHGEAIVIMSCGSGLFSGLSIRSNFMRKGLSRYEKDSVHRSSCGNGAVGGMPGSA